MIVCHKRGASEQEKYNTSNMYTVNLLCSLRTCDRALLRSLALFCAHLRVSGPTAFRTTAFGNCRDSCPLAYSVWWGMGGFGGGSGWQFMKTRGFLTRGFAISERSFTLPALQKNFVNIFFVFAWEFCIEKWRGFLVNFIWSPSPTKRSTKNPRKFRGKFGAKFGAKFGTKIRKIRETFVLQLS